MKLIKKIIKLVRGFLKAMNEDHVGAYSSADVDPVYHADPGGYLWRGPGDLPRQHEWVCD